MTLFSHCENCAAPKQVGPKGKVIGIDHIKELVDDSITNVKKDDPSLITSGRVKLIGTTPLSGLPPDTV